MYSRLSPEALYGRFLFKYYSKQGLRWGVASNAGAIANLRAMIGGGTEVPHLFFLEINEFEKNW
jgi:hypothetical protein